MRGHGHRGEPCESSPAVQGTRAVQSLPTSGNAVVVVDGPAAPGRGSHYSLPRGIGLPPGVIRLTFAIGAGSLPGMDLPATVRPETSPLQAGLRAEHTALPVVAVVGATATGKSDLAIALARRLDGEIINADALQFYRGMDIGTAKVTSAEREAMPHHQLDILEVTQEASVSAYQEGARTAIAEIRSRGRRPILVGGSGLYVRAALDEIEFPTHRREDPRPPRGTRDARRPGRAACRAHPQRP